MMVDLPTSTVGFVVKFSEKNVCFLQLFVVWICIWICHCLFASASSVSPVALGKPTTISIRPRFFKSAKWSNGGKAIHIHPMQFAKGPRVRGCFARACSKAKSLIFTKFLFSDAVVSLAEQESPYGKASRTEVRKQPHFKSSSPGHKQGCPASSIKFLQRDVGRWLRAQESLQKQKIRQLRQVLMAKPTLGVTKSAWRYLLLGFRMGIQIRWAEPYWGSPSVELCRIHSLSTPQSSPGIKREKIWRVLQSMIDPSIIHPHTTYN